MQSGYVPARRVERIAIVDMEESIELTVFAMGGGISRGVELEFVLDKGAGVADEADGERHGDDEGDDDKGPWVLDDYLGVMAEKVGQPPFDAVEAHRAGRTGPSG